MSFDDDDETFAFYQLVLRKHACRIRYILHQLNRGHLTRDGLIRNLEYAALVLELVYTGDDRRLLEEDEEYVRFEPESAVTHEVREWLESTFTKQHVQREKRKFKAVANAIKTGIKLDKIFRPKPSTAQMVLPEAIRNVLQEINSWDFDVHKLNEVTDNNALKYLGMNLFGAYNFFARYKITPETLERFLVHLQTGYSKHNNPYHNLIHAADVTQTTHYILSQTGMIESLTDIEVFACIFAAMLHDYEHTGHTNNFHIQSASNFALLYNDRSVLENHHVSAVYRMMRDHPDSDILSGLTPEEFKEIRNMTVEIVLATDMSTHFAQVKTMKHMLQMSEGINKLKAMSVVVHTSDISHPAKTWDLHYKWTMSVLEEFFRQGDLEASMGLAYSPLCDRNTVNVANSQIGFIEFIVDPIMVVCGEMLTKLAEQVIVKDDASEDPTSPNVSRAPSTCDIRKFPMSMDGRIEIPQPWVEILYENKNKWKKQAAEG